MGEGSKIVICDLAIARDLQLVGPTADYVGALCKRMLGDDALASRILVAAYELLENTIHYSSGPTRARIRLWIDRPLDGSCRLVLETHNQPRPECLQKLVHLLTEMKGAANPHAFYQTLLHRTAKTTEGSGLGLGRIHAEAEMAVSCEVDGDTVHLRAEAQIEQHTSFIVMSQQTQHEDEKGQRTA